MKVTGLEILRCDAGWRNYHFLKLSTDDGIVGWSEFDEGFGSPGVSAVIERLAGRVVGQNAFDHERIYTELYSFTRPAAGGVVAEGLGAIENALLDIKAKALGVPCHVLLGGKVRDRVRVYWSHLRDLADQPSNTLSAGDHQPRRRQGARRRSPREGLYRAQDQHLSL
jgi:L-alanine-DL-glutamate epimerase-like enolase superfamily enzyme